eukprot:sb/3470892/
MDKVKPITDNNQGQLISQLGLLQEVLNSLRIITAALSTDPFHFLDLTRLAGCLDVPKVHLSLLAKVHDAPQEVEETLETLESFKQLDQFGGTQLFVVLAGHLHADLEVLAEIGSQHGLETFNTILHGQCSKVLNQPVGLQEVGVDDGPLDIEDVGVVLKGPLEKGGLFAQLGNVGPVIVGEHLVTQNSISNLEER